MIQGLVWFAVSVGTAFGLIRFTISSIISYKHRHIEPPTKALPSSACTVCGGAWGPWSRIDEDVKYIGSGYDRKEYVVRSQTRQCEDCGVGERRVL